MSTRIVNRGSSQMGNYNKYKVTKANVFNDELNQSEVVTKKELMRQNVILTERQAKEFNAQNSQPDVDEENKWYPYEIVELSGKELKSENGVKKWVGEDPKKEKIDRRRKEHKSTESKD